MCINSIAEAVSLVRPAHLLGEVLSFSVPELRAALVVQPFTSFKKCIFTVICEYEGLAAFGDGGWWVGVWGDRACKTSGASGAFLALEKGIPGGAQLQR